MLLSTKGYLTELSKFKNTVFVSGCFNLLHPGHIYFLEKAKTYGNCLIVAVARDEITKRKRVPVINEMARAYMIDSLACVDFVTYELNKLPPGNLKELLTMIQPAIWVTNTENPNLKVYKQLAKELNIKLKILKRYNKGIFNISTTKIIEEIRK